MEIGTGLLSTFFFLIPFYTLLLYTLLLYLLTPVTVIPKSDKNQRNSCDPKSEKKRGEEKEISVLPTRVGDWPKAGGLNIARNGREGAR